MACGGVTLAAIDQRRLLLGADLLRLPAARAEPAARRRIDRARASRPRERCVCAVVPSADPAPAPPTAAPACRDATGDSYTSSRGTGLDDLPEIHHRHAVGDVADDREIVGDEEVRQTEPGLEILEQVDDLRPGSTRRAPRPARRAPAPRDRGPGLGPRRCAAADRRRTHADIASACSGLSPTSSQQLARPVLAIAAVPTVDPQRLGDSACTVIRGLSDA